MLPGISGRDVCRRMRAQGNQTPILMLTALNGTVPCISELRMGADDYLSKPFDFEDLLARIEVLHRRRTHSGPYQRTSNVGINFDVKGLRVSVDGVDIELSVTEQELVVLLLANPGRALSRERILNAIWGTQADPLTNVIDVYVARLRRKITPYGAFIVTLRGAYTDLT